MNCIRYNNVAWLLILIILFSGCSNKTDCLCGSGKGYIRGGQFGMINKKGKETYYEFAIPCPRCNQEKYKAYLLEEASIDKIIYE